MAPKSGRLRPDNPLAALEHEFVAEQVAALGRLGRQLETDLAALASFDAALAESATAGEAMHSHRRDLVIAASTALWHFVVQREACGLRESRQVMRDFRVPREVQDRMGMFPRRDRQ
jgi:hypothetical protein